MAYSELPPETPVTTGQNTPPLEPNASDVIPPIGITPPQLLAQDAATGKRGAAWRLLYQFVHNDPAAILAVSSSSDDRLGQHLVEFIALGTWAGKPFVVPQPLRSAYARTRLRTLFLPGSGMDSLHAEHVLLANVSDKRPAVRETAIHILGLLGNPTASPVLIVALDDPVPAVRLQAAKALGRVRDASAVPALVGALRGADEQLGSQIFSSLVRIGRAAVPSLINASSSNSAWVRWHCLRALGEICDQRALPVLVHALRDSDHSVAWMAAKNLIGFGRPCIEPVLRLLTNLEVTPWIVETTSYVLRHLYQNDPKLKPYLEPVVQSMRGPAYKIGASLAAQKALSGLQADRVLHG